MSGKSRNNRRKRAIPLHVPGALTGAKGLISGDGGPPWFGDLLPEERSVAASFVAMTTAKVAASDTERGMAVEALAVFRKLAGMRARIRQAFNKQLETLDYVGVLLAAASGQGDLSLEDAEATLARVVMDARTGAAITALRVASAENVEAKSVKFPLWPPNEAEDGWVSRVDLLVNPTKAAEASDGD